MTKELYKKDKAVIRELTGRNGKFGNAALIISFLLCAVGIFSMIFADKDSENVTTAVFVQISWLTYYSFFLRSGGITVFTGAKSASLARETFKGSTLFIDTLCGIPIRRESVFRYVMEDWYMMTFVYFIFLTSMLIIAVTVNAGMSLHAVIFAAMYFLWTCLIFLQSFAVVLKSKKAKKLLDILLIAAIIFFMLYALAAMFISLFKDEGISFALIDNITASVRLSPAAAVIILTAAVIYPAVIGIFFRKKILTKKEVGWYE